jgi:hypothetical protein
MSAAVTVTVVPTAVNATVSLRAEYWATGWDPGDIAGPNKTERTQLAALERKRRGRSLQTKCAALGGYLTTDLPV